MPSCKVIGERGLRRCLSLSSRRGTALPSRGPRGRSRLEVFRSPLRHMRNRSANNSEKADSDRPILFLDIDGVISLFGFPTEGPVPGRFHMVDGIAHCIGESCGPRLARLLDRYEAVWASGWEEKANEYLPLLLELPELDLPALSFDGGAVFGSAHWKLAAIDRYAADRPAAWVDDNLDERCRRWASERDAPTLLIATEPATGLSDEHVDRLLEWADRVAVT